MKLDDTLGQDGRLLRRAQAQLREQASEVQRSRVTADSRALAGALEALGVLSATLGERPAGAVLTTEGAWARVRGHLVFAPRAGDHWAAGSRVWRLSPQGWVRLALPDLFGEVGDSPVPTGVLAAPLWGHWQRLRALRDPQVLTLIFVTVVTGVGLSVISPLVTLALWGLALLIWLARRWAVNRWFSAVESSSLQSAGLPLPQSRDLNSLHSQLPW